MSVPLHVLILEDSRADAELIVRELRRAGFDLDWHLAASESEYVTALETTFDIILADYNLPDLNALEALQHLRHRGLKTPFIVVTGNLGDESAAECIKQGATDYLLKDRLGRLGPAVARALEEKRHSDEVVNAERSLRHVREMAAEALRQANLSLEQRVVDRTRELAVSATSEAALEKRVGERTAALRHETEQRRRAEEALHHGERLQAIGQLTGGIVHDFNNILQLIFHGMRLLRDPGLTEKKRIDLFDNLDGAAVRARDLITQLLAFARKQVLQPKVLDLNALLTDTAQLLGPTLGSGIILETDFASDLWPVIADPNQLDVAILNLAANARDAMLPKGGVFSLQTSNVTLDATPGHAAGDYLCLVVKDTGAGMLPDVLAHVFEPYFTTKPSGKGTGLGLAQVWGFAKQSGGDVTIETRPGLGTTFFFYLPRATATALAAVGNGSAEAAAVYSFGA